MDEIETGDALQASVPTIKKPRRKDNRRSHKKKEPGAVPPVTKVPWVVVWGAKKLDRVLVGCERCHARLSFPDKTTADSIEEALWSFRVDHRNCQDTTPETGLETPVFVATPEE